MNPTRQIYDLQLLDLEIDARTERLAEIEGQLVESEELIQARQVLAERQERRHELERQQREADWEATDLRAKIEPLEAKLYGGTVRNPKELNDLNTDVDQLKARYRRLEDQDLELMVQVEDAQNNLEASQWELARVESEWRSQQDRLLAEQAEIETQLARLREQRSNLAGRLPAAHVALYENLRPQKRGRAVAKVERGMCQGCRISLPVSELQRLRSSRTPVQCSSCGRILYIS